LLDACRHPVSPFRPISIAAAVRYTGSLAEGTRHRMCSRYNLIASIEALRAFFRLLESDTFPPRYNIAPTQPVAIVRTAPNGRRELHLVRWGLIPGWVKDPRGFRLIVNARAESATEKPSFRGALRHRRCLVPATGFYEWTGPARARTPWLFRPRDGGLMAFGALAEHWLGADGSEIETMAILTVPANAAVAPCHDRMPLIVPPEAFDRWLDCRSGETASIMDLLAPAPDGLLDRIEVSPELNSPRREGPDLLQPPRPRLL
jgi:putative SOS response-associated peptidase YedK